MTNMQTVSFVCHPCILPITKSSKRRRILNYRVEEKRISYEFPNCKIVYGLDVSGDFPVGGVQKHNATTRRQFITAAMAANPNSNVQEEVDDLPPIFSSQGNDTHSQESDKQVEQGGSFLRLLSKWSPPRSLWRGLSVPILAGQVMIRILQGKVHKRNTLQQLERVGPKSVGVCLLTSTFVGMAFTIQFVREFTRLGLNRSVGGVLALAFSRELSPVITSIVVAGRIGSAFAAELGTMQVSEQTDTLRVLGTDPVDYLITPRVIACCVAVPILTLICFMVGMASSALLADAVYGVSINIILDSAQKALKPWDIFSAMIKSQVFGGIIAVVSSAWGVTTLGGAKGVGESTTSAVVISLVSIFIADFFLSCCFFQGAGDSLKYCMN